jgi:predicted nucleotidyltransferase
VEPVIGDLERTLSALHEAEVRYLVVGGVAVVLHGHLRVTADVDLVVQLESDNVKRAVRALERLGFRPRAPVPISDFADPQIRESWIRDKGLMVFSLWSPEHPGFEVDLFVREPFEFDAVYDRAVRVQLETCTITVISLPDLIVLKENAGRPRDQEDIAALRALADSDEDDS